MFHMAEEWANIGVELPPGWKRLVQARAKSLKGGQKGLGRMFWCMAFMDACQIPDDELRDRLADLKADSIRDWDRFDDLLRSAMDDAGLLSFDATEEADSAVDEAEREPGASHDDAEPSPAPQQTRLKRAQK